MGSALGQTAAGLKNGAAEKIEVFAYPALPGAPPEPVWGGWAESEDAASSGGPARPSAKGDGAAKKSPEFEKQLAEETRRSFETGRERGRQEGRQIEREAQAALLADAEERRMREAAALIENFAQARDRYLHAVEHEVVALSLAVAARILRREAQMDPLLLTGAVRVALGQLSGSTEVRLRVPAPDLGMWTDAIASLPNLNLKPAVVPGEGMRLGDCVVETALGSVDLGVRSQLGEIERGFFDRTTASSSQQVAGRQEASKTSGEAR